MVVPMWRSKRLDVFERGLVAADHDRERAVACPDVAAGDRGVESLAPFAASCFEKPRVAEGEMVE
jgi:hypothetical protein